LPGISAALVQEPTKGGLEARWQAYMARAEQTTPSRDFPYAHCFSKAATTHGLPETLLLAVARGESDFDPKARSSANAYGLMQILWPGTAEHLGIHSLSKLQQPCVNVDAGARYLKEMLARYQGNLHRALAAYNYGPGRIPVTDGRIPNGAAWYSGYIYRHLDYVLNGTGKAPKGGTGGSGRLLVIRFLRPYRAAAFVQSLQPVLGGIRLDWFRRPAGGFDVMMIYQSPEQLRRGKRLLSGQGIEARG
jgi:hypothetical protein